MTLYAYFHKRMTGKTDVHLVQVHDGMVTLDTNLTGETQALIETLEAIWGPDWVDGGRTIEKREAA